MSRRSIQAGKAVIVVELADKATQSFGKLANGLSSQLMSASRSLRNTSLNLTTGAILSGLAVKSAIRTYSDFETKILTLTAKLGYFGNKTSEQIQNVAALEKRILSLGKASSYTSSQVADASIALAQAGFNVEEISGSLQSVLDLAKGTGWGLSESADMIANAIRTFEIFGKDDTYEQRMIKATSLASQFVKATRLGTVEIVDLQESLKYASGKANDLGIDIQTLLGFFVQMSEAGLKASLAGTSLNTMMSNMTNNLDKVKKKFPNFNIQLDSLGNVDLVGTNAQLIDLMKTMSMLDRTTFIQDIYNMRGARAFSAANEIERVKDFTKEIRSAGAESRLAAALMESGVEGAEKRFTSAFDGMTISMTKTFAPELAALYNLLAAGIGVMDDFVGKNKALAVSIAALPVVLGAAAISTALLSFGVAKLANSLNLAKAGMKGINSVKNLMVGSLSSLGTVLTPKKESIKQQIKKQALVVAKYQTSIDASMVKANSKKTAKARAAAIARVQNSATMQKLIAAQQKLSGLQNRPTFMGKVRGVAAGLGRGIQAVQEKRFYSERAKRFKAAAKVMLKNQQYYQNMGNAIQKRGVGDPRQAFASAAKARASRARYMQKAANAKKMGGSVSVLGSIFQGGSIAKTFSSFANGAKSIFGLVKSFGALTIGLTKFVFSWNGVGMALNVLLLFGDKIPVVVNFFSSLSKGVGGAMSEIGKIFSYASPILDLFNVALTAFGQGDTGTGLKAIQIGFSSLVGIIGNQLTAAWATFSEHVGYVYIFIEKIIVGLETMIMSLVSGISQVVGMAASPIMDSFSSLFSGKGGGGWNSFAEKIVVVVDTFITELFKGIVSLEGALLNFLTDFQSVVGQIVTHLPGTGRAGERIQNDANNTRKLTESRTSYSRAQLEIDRKNREKKFRNTMSISPDAAAQNNRDITKSSNQNSQQLSFDMSNAVRALSQDLRISAMRRKQEIDALQKSQETSPGKGGSQNNQPNPAAITQALQAITGGLGNTRNFIKLDQKRQETLMQEMVEQQSETNSLIRSQGLN